MGKASQTVKARNAFLYFLALENATCYKTNMISLKWLAFPSFVECRVSLKIAVASKLVSYLLFTVKINGQRMLLDFFLFIALI